MRNKVLEEIKKLVGHNNVEVLNRGNSAILISLMKLGKRVLIPEEGGWLSYSKYAENLNKECIKIKCVNAKIDLVDLNEKVCEGDVFIYHSLGGYFAANNIEEIYRVCSEKKCKVVMDVCGSIGTKLGDGKYADVCIGSFGHWKLIDYGQGGFISFKDADFYKKCKPLFSAFSFRGDYNELLNKVINVNNRINLLLEKRRKVITDLKDFQLIRSEEELGFVVIAGFSNETDRLRIIAYCTKNGLEYTTCPREIRLNSEAISIEVKRL